MTDNCRLTTDSGDMKDDRQQMTRQQTMGQLTMGQFTTDIEKTNDKIQT